MRHELRVRKRERYLRAARSILLRDGIDALTEQLGNVTASLDKLDALQPKLVVLIPPQIASQLTIVV